MEDPAIAAGRMTEEEVIEYNDCARDKQNREILAEIDRSTMSGNNICPVEESAVDIQMYSFKKYWQITNLPSVYVHFSQILLQQYALLRNMTT